MLLFRGCFEGGVRVKIRVTQERHESVTKHIVLGK